MTPKRTAFSQLGALEWVCALKLSVQRLAPFYQMRNPIMFVVYLGALLTTIDVLWRLWANIDLRFATIISSTLWATVLFSNFTEAYAEGWGKAQAESLKKARGDIEARRLRRENDRENVDIVPASLLRQGDLVCVRAGEFIPVDGQVIDGIAYVDESAITGESAPVVRESGGDKDAVTGGTRLLSDWIVVRVTANHGESYLDRMISLVEGVHRQKTPNEIALSVLLAAMTLTFLFSCLSLYPFAQFITEKTGNGSFIGVSALTALLVCFAPTTIGGLLSAIGVAGMNRLMRCNIVATSCHAVEAAGDVNVLLLDKTGTITYGNRQAVAFIPTQGINPTELVEASLLASLSDDTPEGKSIVALAKKQFGIDPEKPVGEVVNIPFSAETRVSGITIDERAILKGSGAVVGAYVQKIGGIVPPDVTYQMDKIARQGGTPLMVADGHKVLGVIHLKDVVKAGLKTRLSILRAMGIKSVMVTGDNPLTAAAIASEAGVDDFLAESTPESKLKYIRSVQEKGEVIAMVGDGTNDAPALAQADIALAMNNGTQAAKEASNMIDLDSDPTKFIEIMRIGKQLLITRGALTTCSLASDVAKYFAVFPAVFQATAKPLEKLNFLNLSSPQSAIVSALLFNAVIIIFLFPVAFHGVRYRPLSSGKILGRNLLIYGGGGLIVPFAGIKAIDIFVTFTKALAP